MSDQEQRILLSTLEQLPGYRIVRVIGVVSASAVLAKHIGKDIVAFFRNMMGGEVKEYTEMLAEARDLALRRLAEKAREVGANAVLGLRISTSAISQYAAEVMVYGTAVVIKPSKEVP
ncbi:hypothetical protein Pyrde_1792 [Pyrodictium delaneyi]|uniref:UPF0145 protein Pdsh_04455 n=1 Tax=Pyrodictium delaneyi TaxID=1273541 RepID=A0A0P0N4Y0_9CREN|nr:YbjQ family protein [Pyrodictium delaneyi]ALL01835.1 hypothetical protein Pyrde_1792 [Pyrodictium delaneyi]OWJ54951.1 hypothetical protein Pdsh_04455 [Pyrodictium delaneyi]